MKATDYTHQPFLSIPWKYRQDRNLQGGPLTASQQIYAKGIAMHSTSRLTYDLPSQSHGVATPWPHRFAAQVAIDDSTDGRGSVVFQVFLRQAGKLRRVLTTPIVRAEDAPLPISRQSRANRPSHRVRRPRRPGRPRQLARRPPRTTNPLAPSARTDPAKP